MLVHFDTVAPSDGVDFVDKFRPGLLEIRAWRMQVRFRRIHFSSEPSRTIAPGAFTQPPVMAASKRTKASRKTRARVRSDEENGRWRVRRGRKVYISKGREMTGARAYSAYKKHATARA